MNFDSPARFISCNAFFTEAKVAIFGAPFDGTTSYRPGARFAPASIRSESYGIETYSPYQNKDLTDIKIIDTGDLNLPFGNTKRCLEIIEIWEDKQFEENRLPIMLGGEHLVTLGAVRAAVSRYPNLKVIQFDAHADLRDDYLDEKLSHACVMRRCHEILQPNSIYQFGIRSGDREEFEFAAANTKMTLFNFDGIEKLKDELAGFPVYLTIDLDVLDTSVFPATGTPEAGGVSFTQLMNAVSEISSLNIIGADITELSPPYDGSGASTALACKFLRELILYLYKG